MLSTDRTSFDKGFRKVFCVVPSNGYIYEQTASKYGGDNVFRANAANAEAAFNAAINAASNNGNDVIYVYPGTYTLGATISVTKNVYIIGKADNPAQIVIDADTAAVIGFTCGADADGATIENLTIAVDALATNYGVSIPSTCPNVSLRNVNFTGATATTTSVGISNAGDYLALNGVTMYNVNKGVVSSGSKCSVKNCGFFTTATGALAVDMTTGDYHVVVGNAIGYSSGTGTIGMRFGSAAKCNNVVVHDNWFSSAMATTMLNVNSSTTYQFNNYKDGTTASTGVLSVLTTLS